MTFTVSIADLLDIYLCLSITILVVFTYKMYKLLTTDENVYETPMNTYSGQNIKQNIKQNTKSYSSDVQEHTEVENALSSYEIMRKQREATFDERIAQLKQEVNNTRHGSIAEELHPNVRNLSHQETDERYNPYYQEEVAD